MFRCESEQTWVPALEKKLGKAQFIMICLMGVVIAAKIV